MRDELNAELRRLNRRSSDPRKGVGLSKQQYGGYRSWNHLRSVYQHTCHLFIFFICLFIYSLFKDDKFTIKTDIIMDTNKNSYVLIIKIKTC